MTTEIKPALLTKNQFSRPGTVLQGVKGVVLHWVANPGTTAMNNRNYFENLKNQKSARKDARFASAHFVIGLQGEVVRCIPENEMAYHVGAKQYTQLAFQKLGAYPNNDTLGIELGHPDWTGAFTDETLASCRGLVIDLLERHKLTVQDVYRHFDITGKDCPHYFVQHDDAWRRFLETIG
jgi:N-acetylmuramoyl-L-alanine amidase